MLGAIQPEAGIQDCQFIYSMYVWGTYKMGLAPFRFGIAIQCVSKCSVWPAIKSWSFLCIAIWYFAFAAVATWSDAQIGLGHAKLKLGQVRGTWWGGASNADIMARLDLIWIQDGKTLLITSSFHCRKQHVQQQQESVGESRAGFHLCTVAEWMANYTVSHDMLCTRQTLCARLNLHLAGILVQCKPDKLWKWSSRLNNIQAAQALHLALMFPLADNKCTYSSQASI